MGFLNGSVTFERYRVTEDPTDAFGEDHIEILKKFSINQSFGNLHEEPAIGFSAGSHLLDTQFSYEKNIIGDAMHFGVRIDACKIPGPMKRAWMAMELADQLIENPGKRPTRAQREEAKASVEARCIAEAEKGNFIRQDMTSVLWDGITGTMYLGSTSEKVNDQCLGLLNRAFGLEFNKVTSGSLALEIADEAERLEEIYASNPTAFHPEGSDTITWWSGMKDDYSYLGNEFFALAMVDLGEEFNRRRSSGWYRAFGHVCSFVDPRLSGGRKRKRNHQRRFTSRFARIELGDRNGKASAKSWSHRCARRNAIRVRFKCRNFFDRQRKDQANRQCRVWS